MSGFEIEGYYVENNVLWFSLAAINGLCRMNLDTFVSEYISTIPGEDLWQSYLYSDIKRYKNKLIMAPMNAREIALYDLNSGEFEKVDFEGKKHLGIFGYQWHSSFYSSYIAEGNCFMIPFRFPGIMCLELESRKVNIIDNWLCEIESHFNEKCVMFRQDMDQYLDENIYFVSLYYSMVSGINPHNKIVRTVARDKIGTGRGFVCIKRLEDHILVIRKDPFEAILFDAQWRIAFTRRLPDHIALCGQVPFIKSVLWNGSVYLIPYNALYMVCYDGIRNEMSVIHEWETGKEPKYIAAWIYDNRLYCCNKYVVDIFALDGKKVEERMLQLEDGFYEGYFERSVENGNVAVENESIRLKDFLGFIERKSGEDTRRHIEI